MRVWYNWKWPLLRWRPSSAVTITWILTEEKQKYWCWVGTALRWRCCLGEERLESLQSFTYLGSKITSDVINRIHKAKTTFSKKPNFFVSNNIETHLREQQLKTLVWNVLLYGNQTLILGEQEKGRVGYGVTCEFKRFHGRIKWRKGTVDSNGAVKAVPVENVTEKTRLLDKEPLERRQPAQDHHRRYGGG